MRAAGHEAIGVDPRAPEGAEYRRVRFEELIDAGTSMPWLPAPRYTTWQT
jgi:hypothetical protein